MEFGTLENGIEENRLIAYYISQGKELGCATLQNEAHINMRKPKQTQPRTQTLVDPPPLLPAKALVFPTLTINKAIFAWGNKDPPVAIENPKVIHILTDQLQPSGIPNLSPGSA
ncbi:unnamed protein product [Sphenostylis stenocarpa]|uniref:Uncharacterized protein n=1 Tax=Sphenostylis stenocarpa TaxID=92480 RepID=A0AA86VVC1_9FABA|nr:unnamed protein product [Sphenostylis stenocarpa]